MSMTDKPLVDESEWEMQERAMRAALGHETGAMDAATADYRVVAEALVSMPLSEPPQDFAAGVAQCIARHDAGLERGLSRLLLVVFVVVLLVLGVPYGGQGWLSLQQAFGDAALGWMLLGTGCVAMSWLFSRLLELANPTDEPRRTPESGHHF